MDRLSQLPDSVIFHIFWFLPMKNVVQTTILSKRWQNLWTTTPLFNFDDYVTHIYENINFLNRALLRWNGVRVLKFKVHARYHDEVFGDIDLWMHFAKKNEVEELYLQMITDTPECTYYDDSDVLLVPQCLYSCSSLKQLLIENCYFRIKGNVQWNQLKCLTMIEVFGVNEHVINQILSGSPQLEVLSLSFIERGESLCVRSTSLKVLSIYKFYYDRGNLSLHTELRICAPNLETLEIKGIPFSKCLLMNVSSLAHVTLGYSGLHNSYEYFDFSGIDCFSSTSHFLGDLFGKIIPSIQHVENVTLLSCCVKVLGAMIERCMNSSSPNVKSLQLGYLLKDNGQFVGIIEIFPRLKKLVLKVRSWDRYQDERDSICFDAERYDMFEANLPKSFVQKLKIVEVTWCEGDSVFPFLGFLLKYATKLEKMVFRVKGVMPPSRPSESLLSASQKLLRMPRSAPTVKFTFCEC